MKCKLETDTKTKVQTFMMDEDIPPIAQSYDEITAFKRSSWGLELRLIKRKSCQLQNIQRAYFRDEYDAILKFSSDGLYFAIYLIESQSFKVFNQKKCDAI